MTEKHQLDYLSGQLLLMIGFISSTFLINFKYLKNFCINLQIYAILPRLLLLQKWHMLIIEKKP